MMIKRFFSQPRISRFLRPLLTANLWLYLLLAALGTVIFDQDALITEFLNNSKESGGYVNYFAIGQQPLDPKRMEQALAYYAALAPYVTKTALIEMNQGFCLFYLNRRQEAAQHYQRAVEQLPVLYMLYQDLGTIYASLGDYRKANAYYQEALNRLLPEGDALSAILVAVKKNAAQRPGYFDDTELLLSRRDYDRQIVFYQLIDSAKEIRDYEQIRGVAFQGLKIFPDDARLYFEAGLASLQVEKFEEAIFLFGRVLANNPRNSRAYRYRAQCYQQAGMAEQARQDLDMAERYQGQEPEEFKLPFVDLHVFYDRGLFFVGVSF